MISEITMVSVNFDDIKQAHERIKKSIHRTPILTSQAINAITGADLFFKCENFQKGGAFKFRGAMNAVLSLSDEEAKFGVVTHSSGNHAGALTLAAKIRGCPAYLVMPEMAPKAKKAAVLGYGGKITECESSMSSREEVVQQVIAKTNAKLIHPFNDERIIAGQGTAAIELIEDVEELDVVLAPVSGGGLLSGTAISTKSLNKNILVYGCEPENADDAYRSLQTGVLQSIDNPKTIADGLRASLGEKTFAIIKKYVDGIFLVSEEEIVQAMKYLWERMKIVVEPSGAVSFAALLKSRPELNGKRIGIILSGGNVDLGNLPF